ncbi:submandibular gland secretory Glx-rich protein CA-like [Procambarus clarkii]|uniref:submandibular gland secretory Glx-rich protein CA-like n=1 Tax=Procambarus clarkii TaxID=6728 RepID=UPI003741FA40
MTVETVTPSPTPQEKQKRRPEIEEAARRPLRKQGTRKRAQNPQSEQPFSTAPLGHHDHHEPHQQPSPHCGKPSAEERTEVKREPQPSAVGGTWTSATTVSGESDASGTSPSTSQDAQSLNSPTSAKAEEERRERLSTGCTPSEPDAEPETQATWAGRTDTRRRMAAASTEGETGPRIAGGPTATPSIYHSCDKTRAQGEAQQQETKKTSTPRRDHPEDPREQLEQRYEQEDHPAALQHPEEGPQHPEDCRVMQREPHQLTGRPQHHPWNPPPQGAEENPPPGTGSPEGPHPQNTRQPDAPTGHTENMFGVGGHSTPGHSTPEARLKKEYPT